MRSPVPIGALPSASRCSSHAAQPCERDAAVPAAEPHLGPSERGRFRARPLPFGPRPARRPPSWHPGNRPAHGECNFKRGPVRFQSICAAHQKLEELTEQQAPPPALAHLSTRSPALSQCPSLQLSTSPTLVDNTPTSQQSRPAPASTRLAAAATAGSAAARRLPAASLPALVHIGSIAVA